MRVLFLGRNRIWIYTLLYGFYYAGHQVKASGPLTDQNIPLIIDEFRPDLIFTVGWGPDLSKKNQDLIRKYVQAAGVPHFYWATEDSHLTTTYTMPLIIRMQPDFVFTLTSSMVIKYKNLGIKAAHLDFGYQPSVHHRVKVHDQYHCSIAVLANAYPNVFIDNPRHYRYESIQTLVRPLLEENIRIDFWGWDWDKMKPFLGRDIPREWIRGYLPYLETHKVYSSADITIGLQNYPTQVTQRTYEILGSGGFLITSDTPAVRSLFKPGRDLVVSSSPVDTLRLVLLYLNNPYEREQIRKHGKIAVTEHSYKNRAE